MRRLQEERAALTAALDESLAELHALEQSLADLELRNQVRRSQAPRLWRVARARHALGVETPQSFS